MSPAAGVTPLDALSPREVECLIDPLRRLRATAVAGGMTAEQAMSFAIRIVALGLVRLSAGPDLNVDEPNHFVESQS